MPPVNRSDFPYPLRTISGTVDVVADTVKINTDLILPESSFQEFTPYIVSNIAINYIQQLGYYYKIGKLSSLYILIETDGPINNISEDLIVMGFPPADTWAFGNVFLDQYDLSNSMDFTTAVIDYATRDKLIFMETRDNLGKTNVQTPTSSKPRNLGVQITYILP